MGRYSQCQLIEIAVMTRTGILQEIMKEASLYDTFDKVMLAHCQG